MSAIILQNGHLRIKTGSKTSINQNLSISLYIQWTGGYTQFLQAFYSEALLAG